jgi:hypothetical protein
MAARWMNVLLAIWLVAGALLWGVGSRFFADHLVLGISIFLVAFLAMGESRFRRVNTVLGASVLLSPFVFGYVDRSMALNDIVVGILVVNFALARAAPRPARAALGAPGTPGTPDVRDPGLTHA